MRNIPGRAPLLVNENEHNTVKQDKDAGNEIRLTSRWREGGELALALAHGADLEEAGLLTILLSQHLDQAQSRNVAAILLKRFKNLSGVLQCSVAKLLSVPGMTHSAALGVLHINQLLKAVSKAAISDVTLLDCDARVIEYCCALLRRIDHEQFHALYLNRRGELLHHACLQRGTIDHVTVYPREFLRHAIEHNASFIILAHNHPVGKAAPSRGDVQMTNSLAKLSSAIGAVVFNHVIVSNSDCYSFRREGLLSTGHTAGNNKTGLT